jgi:hypothetical protein
VSAVTSSNESLSEFTRLIVAALAAVAPKVSPAAAVAASVNVNRLNMTFLL